MVAIFIHHRNDVPRIDEVLRKEIIIRPVMRFLYVLHMHIESIYTRFQNYSVIVHTLNCIFMTALCLQVLEAVSRLHRCAGSSEPSLFAYVISTEISNLAYLYFKLYFLLCRNVYLGSFYHSHRQMISNSI